MTVDYQKLLYDRLYSELGVPATLRIDDWGEDIEVTAIPKIDGVAVSVAGDPSVQTIQPAAAIRVSELTAAGITVAEIASGTIEMSGAVWRILSPLPRPSPNGEADGELWLILVEN